jgi:hypothetical protein
MVGTNTRIPEKMHRDVKRDAEKHGRTMTWVWNKLYQLYLLNIDAIYYTQAAGKAKKQKGDKK